MRLARAKIGALILLGIGAFGQKHDDKIRLEVKRDVDSSIANIYLYYLHDIDVAHYFTYGPCHSSNSIDKSQPVIARQEPWDLAKRLVWVIPEYAKPGGCASAWTEETDVLLGKSNPVKIKQKPRKQKRADGSIPMTKADGINVEGAWFDGVSLLEAKGSYGINETAVKQKSQFFVALA